VIREIKKILIANRGEIAVRIIRTCQKLGLDTVAVYSEADRGAPHTLLADEAFCLGGVAARDSYLKIEAVLAITKECQADAIHPGYGFLAENPEFAEAVAKAGLVFIGPTPESMRLLGHKDQARQVAVKAGVPVVPGYDGKDQSLAVLRKEAESLGFPLLIKARAGGGGKGIRRVANIEAFNEAVEGAKREALAFFSDDRLILEKLVVNPRHVEVQLLGDSFGNVIHLFERDCSLQRRHQKVIEEAPATWISGTLREKILNAAILIAKASKLSNASTAEFLAAPEGQAEQFYFLEVNCRIQVEHPVTEMVTGVDLIEWQIRVARGEPLSINQANIHCHGVAIEARLYAEDPSRGFIPRTGTITRLNFPSPEHPQSLRIDHALALGQTITSHYDPMLAKIIVWGENREVALRRLRSALLKVELQGCGHNRDFLVRLTEDQGFNSNKISISYLDRELDRLVANPPLSAEARALSVAIFLFLRADYLTGQFSALSKLDPFEKLPQEKFSLTLPRGSGSNVSFDVSEPGDSKGRSSSVSTGHLIELTATKGVIASATVEVDGREVALLVAERNLASGAIKSVEVRGALKQVQFTPMEGDRTRVARAIVNIEGREYQVSENLAGIAGDSAAKAGVTSIKAPLPGRLLAHKTTIGAVIKIGTVVALIESMKMEHSLIAPVGGKVKALFGKAGDSVKEGQELVVIE